jgi:hypothetical protein
MVAGQAEAGEAPVDLAGLEDLMGEAVLAAGGKRCFEKAAAVRSRVERAGGEEEGFAIGRARLAPSVMARRTSGT